MRAIAREKYEESSSTRHLSNALYQWMWMDSQRTCVRSNDASGILTGGKTRGAPVRGRDETQRGCYAVLWQVSDHESDAVL